MLNLGRRDALPDPKNPVKPALGPAPYGNASNNPSLPHAGAARPLPAGTPARDNSGLPTPTREAPPPAAASAPVEASPPSPAQPAPSKLFVGVNIKLKGVEISDCDVLVVEGDVEATVSSKAMEIAQPGKLNGTANIDVAEIHGIFTGELTARKKLVVHGTGRVSGTIRYGKLIVAEGGELAGDVKRLETQETSTEPSVAPTVGLFSGATASH